MLHPLGHGLDHEIDVTEAVVVVVPRDQGEFAVELGGLHLAGVDPGLPQRAGLLEP